MNARGVPNKPESMTQQCHRVSGSVRECLREGVNEGVKTSPAGSRGTVIGAAAAAHQQALRCDDGSRIRPDKTTIPRSGDDMAGWACVIWEHWVP